MITSVRVEQPARLQIRQQPGHRPIGFRGVLGVVGLDVVVRVPGVGVLVADAARENLHEADAALDEPARHQALPAERLGDLVVEAVERLRGVGFARDVDRLGRASLHPVRELVRRDARRQLAVAGKLLHVELVQLRQRVEPRALVLGRHARPAASDRRSDRRWSGTACPDTPPA